MTGCVRMLADSGATLALAEGLASVLRGGDPVLLRGELGSGKTTFVRGLARGLGADLAMVASPTFVMVNQYPAGSERTAGARGSVRELVHIDAYRLSGEEELDALGWDRFVHPGPEGCRVRDGVVLVVEWPERVASALPAEACVVSLAHEPGGARSARVELPASWQSRPGAVLLLERPPVRCPVTGRWTPPTAATYPFADERARAADLGHWLGGRYRISGPIRSDEDEGGEA